MHIKIVSSPLCFDKMARTVLEKGRKVKDGVAAGNEERARAHNRIRTSATEETRAGPEREKSTKFISGHPRAEPRPGTNSIASIALFRERAHGTLAGAAGSGVNGWLVGRRPSDSDPLVSSSSPSFARRDPA